MIRNSKMQNQKQMYSLMATIEQKSKRKRFRCFIPGCNKYAIKSHSQSRANSLNNICENGQVVTRLVDFFTWIKSSSPAECFKKIGVRKASVFQGFCQQHDDEYFKQADTISLDTLNKETLSKLAFRTFAYEVRAKETALHTTRLMECNGKGLIDTEACGYRAMGINNFLQVTYPFYMEKWFSVLKNKNYTAIKHIVFEFNENIGLSCSSMIDPSPTMNDIEELRNLDIPNPAMFFNVIPKQSSTIVVFSCFPEEKQQVKNFIDKNKRLSQIVFNYCEEILFNPSLFDPFSNEMKGKIINGLESWGYWEEVDFSNFFPNLVLTSPQYI